MGHHARQFWQDRPFDTGVCNRAERRNAVRLFTGEAFFAMDEGIPHFDIELGKTRPALSVLRARMREAALNVEGVLDAQITLDDVQERKLTGEILLTVADGDKSSKITLTL